MTFDPRHNEDLTTWGKVKRWNANYPRTSRVVWFSLALAIVAAGVWYLTPDPRMGFRTATQGGPGGRGGMNMAQPVGVAQAVRGDINVTVNALGTVTPLATAQVRPQASGMLMKINFTEGQMVKAGDVLAEIDPRPFQAALMQAEANLARDQATLANQKLDLQRYEELAKQNAISQQQLATSRTQVAATTAVVQGGQAAVQNARINLGYTRVVSPVSGRVGLHLVDVGNIVSSGQSTPLVVVTQLDPMSVLFTVPEDNVAVISRRLAEGAELVVDAYDRSQTNKITSGRLATVDNVIDPSTGSVKLRALFDNSDGKLFPSQFVNIRLFVDTLRDQTVLPLPAIQRGSEGSFVFIVTPEMRVMTRAVKTGVQDGERIAVTEGLQPGDTVVVEGADRLRDGAMVTVPDKKAEISAPSAGAAAPGRQGGGRGMSAAVIARVTEACQADMKKLCSTPEQLAGRGPAPGGAAAAPEAQAVFCLMRNRADLSRQCTAALPAGRGRGGNAGGGGGFP